MPIVKGLTHFVITTRYFNIYFIVIACKQHFMHKIWQVSAKMDKACRFNSLNLFDIRSDSG